MFIENRTKPNKTEKRSIELFLVLMYKNTVRRVISFLGREKKFSPNNNNRKHRFIGNSYMVIEPTARDDPDSICKIVWV